ncbi:C-5 cytosine-specific DNA methylase [compost metagenome]
MTMRECARLQSMDELAYLPSSEGATHKALGNAVNVTVIREIARNLVGVNDHSNQTESITPRVWKDSSLELINRVKTTKIKNNMISL